eukprot:COSAG01_NODE_7388_length_3228_cov_16.686162_4_plen_113_part_00
MSWCLASACLGPGNNNLELRVPGVSRENWRTSDIAQNLVTVVTQEMAGFLRISQSRVQIAGFSFTSATTRGGEKRHALGIELEMSTLLGQHERSPLSIAMTTNDVANTHLER